MKQQPPALAPLLRSDRQGELLALLFLEPTAEFTLTQLAAALGTSIGWVHAEVSRLVESGWLTERRVGRSRLVSTNRDNPLAPALVSLLEPTYGPTAVLPQILAEVPGVEQALIYGSWASRRTGTVGPPPNDLDVLVVGAAKPGDLARAQRLAGERLGLDVNMVQVTAEDWAAPSRGFLRTVSSGALVPLRLDVEAA